MQSRCASVDTSLLLRDLLHHKEALASQVKDSDSVKAGLYRTDCNSEMISPLLHSKSSDMAYSSRDSELDNELDIEMTNDNNSSVHDGDQSDDPDDRSLDVSGHEEALKPDIGNGERKAGLNDSKEAKRANVDKLLLTCQRQSPHSIMDLSVGVTAADIKRQKRKQPQPQQHDASSLQFEDSPIRRQIQRLEEQLEAMKRKQDEDLCMYDNDVDDEETEEDEEAVARSHPCSPVCAEVKRPKLEVSVRSTSSPRTENGYEYGSRVSPGSDVSGKRQKRKQTQPQQHDNNKDSVVKETGTPSKCNNNNNNNNNNNSFYTSKNYSLAENNHGVEEVNPTNLLTSDSLFRGSLYRGFYEKDIFPHIHNGFASQFYRDNFLHRNLFMRPDLDPLSALRNDSKSWQTRHEAISTPETEAIKVPPPDLTKIANAIKAEVTQALSKAIETAVSKVFNEKPAGGHSDSSNPTEPGTQKHQEKHQPAPGFQPSQPHAQKQQHEHQQQQPVKQHHQPSGLFNPFLPPVHQPVPPPPQQQQHQQPPLNGSASERETLKEAVGGNVHEKKPELNVPLRFSDHLHFLERFSNRAPPAEKSSAFEPIIKDCSLITPHQGPTPLPFHPFQYYLPHQVLTPLYPGEPEQTEALPLITQKKKRTKVTDTRLGSPRGKPGLLQDNTTSSTMDHAADAAPRHIAAFSHFMPPLPTSVAIPNPSLSHHMDLLALTRETASYSESRIPSPQDHSRSSPRSASESPHFLYDRSGMSMDMSESGSMGGSHLLRKAKLMFFYTRYPSSSILKMYFPDVMFNKNNTAQLVKWFSNFREFFYIQMEKYARQALAEGCKHAEDLVVATDSELFRHLNLHYNRNNQIEVPINFLAAVQAALREFFKSIQSNKDAEPSWKKAIYKIIARMDETLPDFFKSPNWMEQLTEN